MEASLNTVMASVILALTVLWFREGRKADLSALSQLTRIVLMWIAALSFITSIDRLAIGESLHPNHPLWIPFIAAAFRGAIIVTLAGLVASTMRARRSRNL